MSRGVGRTFLVQHGLGVGGVRRRREPASWVARHLLLLRAANVRQMRYSRDPVSPCGPGTLRRLRSSVCTRRPVLQLCRERRSAAQIATSALKSSRKECLSFARARGGVCFSFRREMRGRGRRKPSSATKTKTKMAATLPIVILSRRRPPTGTRSARCAPQPAREPTAAPRARSDSHSTLSDRAPSPIPHLDTIVVVVPPELSLRSILLR